MPGWYGRVEAQKTIWHPSQLVGPAQLTFHILFAHGVHMIHCRFTILSKFPARCCGIAKSGVAIGISIA